MIIDDDVGGIGDLFDAAPVKRPMAAPNVRRLIETAAEIVSTPVPVDRDRAFLARQLVQATLLCLSCTS